MSNFRAPPPTPTPSSTAIFNKRSRKISRTDSELTCEETDSLAADLQSDVNSIDIEDDDLEDDYQRQELPPPPDGGYGWVICFASFMCNMIVDGIAYTFGIFLSEFVNYFGEGKGKVAWVGSLLSGVYLSAGPVVSALANKYGVRAVCISGSIIACIAFVLATFSTSVDSLMITYGVLGGFGFGMIYLPAVVAVGYYFETKRSLATGIAVCGSGVGTFAFAPLASFLLERMGWKNALIIFAGLILNCAVFGAMMRPLRYPKKKTTKPLMQRMYEEKRMQMERGSIGGSYFMVQLPDGTMERRMKMPLNADPGVHSSLALDQLAMQQQSMHTVSTLPTISEAAVIAGKNHRPPPDFRRPRRPHRVSETDAPNVIITDRKDLIRNASQPNFANSQQRTLPKNVSSPSFDRVRKISGSERYKPSLAAIPAASKGNMSIDSYASRISITSRPPSEPKAKMVRPMSRKDIFYSGSVTNLPQYQSQKSLASYRQSVVSLTKFERMMRDTQPVDRLAEAEMNREQYDLCPCFSMSDSFKSALGTMLDLSLLKDPVFFLIGVSNIFGMAGLYVPFVYLVDAARNDGIDASAASFLLSIIGITNTIGRVLCGYVADFPQVDSLLLNNICLLVSTIAVALTPLCHEYWAYVTMAVFFGFAVSGYISLTSIILVDLMGLDKLTNAFGLLILFRGIAAILGSPLAGAVYDYTQTYDIPFYMAGAFFAFSTVTSFIAPCMRRFSKLEDMPLSMDALEPINEELELDNEDDEDEPITMIPKLGRNYPTDNPPSPSPTALKPNPFPEPIKEVESVL